MAVFKDKGGMKTAQKLKYYISPAGAGFKLKIKHKQNS